MMFNGSPISCYEQIVSVLVKCEFEVAVRDLLLGAIHLSLHKKHPNIASLNIYRRMRLAVQELVPTYIKFAQIISTYLDRLQPRVSRCSLSSHRL